MADDQKAIPLEKGLENLEAIVEQLENGDLSLERSLELFEQGVEVSERCRKQLDAAQTRVEILMKKKDGVEARPFGVEAPSDPDDEIPF